MKIKKLKNVKIHNYVDYGLVLLLVTSPWIFKFDSGTIETKIIVTIGLGLLLVNLITYHKLGLTKILCVKTHKKIDFFLGLFLCAAPFLYQFHKTIFLPHLLLGLSILLNTLFIKLPSKKLKKADLI